MFKTISALSLLLTFNAFAGSMTLKCEGTYNLDKVVSETVTIGDSERNKKFAEFEEFEFILTKNGPETVELQAYNGNEPSRSYATASINEKGEFVMLSIWKREYLLEIRCTL